MGALLEAERRHLASKTELQARERASNMAELRIALCNPDTARLVTNAELTSGKLKKRGSLQSSLKKEHQPSFLQRLKRAGTDIAAIGIGIGSLGLDAAYFVAKKSTEVAITSTKSVVKKGRERWESSGLLQETALIASAMAIAALGITSMDAISHFVNTSSSTSINAGDPKYTENSTRIPKTAQLPISQTEIPIRRNIELSEKEEPGLQPATEQQPPAPKIPEYTVYRIKAGDNMFNILKGQGLKTDVRTLHQIMLANPNHFKDLGFELQDYYNSRQFKKILKEAGIIFADWELNILATP